MEKEEVVSKVSTSMTRRLVIHEISRKEIGANFCVWISWVATSRSWGTR